MTYKDSNFSLTSTLILYSFNNIHLEPQKSQNCQKWSWGEKKKKAGGNTLSNFKIYYKATIIKTVLYFYKDL